MKKLSFLLTVAVVSLAACVEPVYQMEDLNNYPTIPSFPKEFQGAFENNKDSLIVQKTSFRTVSSNTDIPKSGQLGGNVFLRKHGAYYVIYSTFNDNFYHLRFFSFSGQSLVVRRIRDDEGTLAQIKLLSTKYFVKADPDGFTQDQYYFKCLSGTLHQTVI